MQDNTEKRTGVLSRAAGALALIMTLAIAPQAIAETHPPTPEPSPIESTSPEPADAPAVDPEAPQPQATDEPEAPELPATLAPVAPQTAAPNEAAALELSAMAGPAAGAVPVYRFYSAKGERNYYTTSAQERNEIIAKWPNVWTYAGVPFGAYTTQVEGTVPLYRLYSDWLDTSVFTTSAAQRDEIIKRWPTVWRSIGVAFYVYPMEATNSGIWPVAHYYSARHEEHVYVAGWAERDAIDKRWAHVWRFVGEEFKVPSGPAEAPLPLNQRDQWKHDAGIARGDWWAVDYIVQRESGWNPNAVNSSSGACGLVQIMPLHTAAYKTCKDPVANLRWADGYAKGRYGSWSGAYNFWVSNHWW